jgi:tetratricopeptide (TPR) repeat protein/transcriptional regulator with XRE-family HTH domain
VARQYETDRAADRVAAEAHAAPAESAFPATLQRLRVAARLTQEQLADRSGLSVRSVSQLERGRVRYPRRKSVHLLGRALGLADQALAAFEALARAEYWADRNERPDGEAPGAAGPAGEPGAAPAADPPPAGRAGTPPATDPPAATPRSADRAVLARLPADNGRSAVPMPASVVISAISRSSPVPAQLPPDVGDFTGRDGELRWLDGRLGTAAGGSTPGAGVVISVLSGPPGAGKTALAVRWAHRARRQFPDGQLYVNLRGYDPEMPVSPDAALAWFLSALGVSGDQVPVDLDSRTARYRTEMASRRMLVLLDNAASVEQVQPLLPGCDSCVVVTSRSTLSGLVALHGARRLDLDLLPSEDAITLLCRLVGERLLAEPDLAATLAGYCGGLPLVIRVAAELVSLHPTTPLADQVAELADDRRRLELLEAGGDCRAAVRSVFSWSYRHLPPPAARMFRLVGLHPGMDFDPYAAAALAGVGLPEGHALLDQLARAHLIHPTGRHDRYGMHDMLRAYAAEMAGTTDAEADRHAALTRLFDLYLVTAAAAMNTLHPAERHLRPAVRPVDTPVPAVSRPATARAWLDTERRTLASVCAYTSSREWPAHAILLAATLHRHLDGTSRYTDALSLHTDALHAARRADDQVAEAQALTNLGVTYWRLGQYATAADRHERALALFRALSDRVGEAFTLVNLGGVHWRLGRYPAASDCLERALALFRAADDRAGESQALTNLGLIHRRLGRYELAIGCERQALALCRQRGHQLGEAFALNSLGVVYTQLRRYRGAAGYLRAAVALFRELGDRAGEAEVLTNLGVLDVRIGQHRRAADRQRRALALLDETGYRHGEASALNGLAEALLAGGQPREAMAQHSAALAVAAETGDRDEQARAHSGLACGHAASGDPARARRHWQQALTLYTALGTPNVADVRAQISALP